MILTKNLYTIYKYKISEEKCQKKKRLIEGNI